MEFLYTIQHKIGAEASTKSAEAKLEELYTYGQKAFKVSDEQHNRLLSVTNRAKVTQLLVTLFSFIAVLEGKLCTKKIVTHCYSNA